ncbi:MAG: peptidylprolyl isomerase, partial [Dehalococcoidales bacterium]|nr:peptidylprolyl isomerase [Dehalococcoidales bacterium]
EKEVPTFVEQRHIMAMLLESEERAVEVRARIEAGEDFGSLAGELSFEKVSADKDGDLGWQPEGALAVLLGTSVVDEYAFSSEVGILSAPIHDEEVIKNTGYWIVKVLEREEQADVRGILLWSEEEAQWVREKLMDDKDFGEMAAVLSEHESSKKLDGYLGLWAPDEVSPAFAEFVFNPEIEPETISEPIFDDTIVTEGGYWLIEVLEKKERANVLGILLGIEEEAQQVKSRLDAGEDFGELAKEFSQHEWSKEDGGDLGWLKRGKESPAFDEFLFNSELETVSEPIRYDTFSTKGGYWLIKVVDKDDNRQIDDSYRCLLKTRALEEWIESLWNDPENNIENYLDDDKKSWAIEHAKKR